MTALKFSMGNGERALAHTRDTEPGHSVPLVEAPGRGPWSMPWSIIMGLVTGG